MEFDDLKRPGGTSGGLVEFVIGFIMTIAGGYMLISRVIVTSGFWNWGGYNTFGLSLVPLIFGIAFVFFNGKSIIGWILIAIRHNRHRIRHFDESAGIFPADEPFQHDNYAGFVCRRDRFDRTGGCGGSLRCRSPRVSKGDRFKLRVSPLLTRGLVQGT